MSEKKLPYQGEYLAAENKKSSAVILFVHFYGGTKKSMRRHAEFVNELGFDAVIFNLEKEQFNFKSQMISSKLNFGMKHIWADQIENMMNQFSEDKIIFAFSNPSASAIEAIARRGAADIKALICDGGPSGEIWSSIYNFFTHEKPVSNILMRAAYTTLSTAMWSPIFNKEVHDDLNKFPEMFPVLSIRGWKDKLISPDMIDKIFEPHLQIDFQKLGLPQAGHLNGLKDFPEEYKHPTSQFLKRFLS